MKKIVTTACLFLLPLLAAAEPQAYDPMSELGLNTVLTVLRPLNFPANSTPRLSFAMGEIVSDFPAIYHPQCNILLVNDEGILIPSLQDREVLIGTPLKISKISASGVGGYTTSLRFEQSNLEIDCFYNPDQGRGGRVSIADFEDALNGIVATSLATPVIVH